MAKKDTPPDRIRGFTSLADHQAATAEGTIRISEINGYSCDAFGTMVTGGIPWSISWERLPKARMLAAIGETLRSV